MALSCAEYVPYLADRVPGAVYRYRRRLTAPIRRSDSVKTAI